MLRQDSACLDALGFELQSSDPKTRCNRRQPRTIMLRPTSVKTANSRNVLRWPPAQSGEDKPPATPAAWSKRAVKICLRSFCRATWQGSMCKNTRTLPQELWSLRSCTVHGVPQFTTTLGSRPNHVKQLTLFKP